MDLFNRRYPELIKHLVVNDMYDEDNTNINDINDIEDIDSSISITARSKELYYCHLFPDIKKKDIENKLKNIQIYDIGCGYNPVYDESLITYLNKEKKKFKSDILGIDIINLKMDNYKKMSIYNISKIDKKTDLILINNLLYFWINEPKKLLKIYKELYKILNDNGEIRIFPCYMGNFNMDNQELKDYIYQNFYFKMIKPKYFNEDPFYQDKSTDNIYLLEGLCEKENKINEILNSYTIILKKL